MLEADREGQFFNSVSQEDKIQTINFGVTVW